MATDELRPVVSAWVNKIRLAWDFKQRQFGDDAAEAMQFFSGPYDFLYGLRNPRTNIGFSYTGDEGEFPRPTFAMTTNKVAELVQLFGPALYHRNPIRQVNPRKTPLLPISFFGDPSDPNVQAQYQQLQEQVGRAKATDEGRAALLQAYLNYTPNALDLKRESRWAIDEALIKGLGVLWTETYRPPGASRQMVGSFYDTVDNLLIDPDCELLRDAKWIARRRTLPYWEVERQYNLPPDSLKRQTGNFALESYGMQAEVAALGSDGDYRRKQGLTNDLMVFWVVYSKMGAGGRLSGIRQDLRGPLDAFGDFIHLVVADGVPFPLNLPPPLIEGVFGEDLMLAAQLLPEFRKRVEWPTPFWADDAWPFVPIAFHTAPRKVWPVSHISPGMGELKFINWAYSFLAGKVRTSCRDFIAVAKSAGDDLKDRIRTGPDYTMLEVEALHESIDRVVKFLQHPEFNGEIYKVIQGVTHNFELRTGLTELMYGQSATQMRSAEEANVKSEGISIRPDDMANKVEDAMSDAARQEALAARWHLTGEDVAPVLGPLGASWWDQLLSTSDPAEVIHSLEYRIEAGSAKKPNKARDVANMQAAMQQLFPTLVSYANVSGDVGPVNALITMWAKSQDFDATPFLMRPPQPPPAPVGAPGAPPAAGGAAGGAPPHAGVGGAPPAPSPRPPAGPGPPVPRAPGTNRAGAVR